MKLNSYAQEWFERGQQIQVAAHSLFVVRSQNQNSDLPYLVILHGYPTCGFDYHKVLPTLSQHFRVVIHDHIGFGFSDKPDDYAYTLIDQCDVALQLWRQLGIKKAHVLAHDYGTSVATELVARDNHGLLNDFQIKTMTLCNGSMHIELAKLRVIQRLLLSPITGPIISKLSSQKTLGKNLRQIYHDAGQLDASEVEALWQMMSHNNGQKIIHKTTQYIKQRKQFWHRWIGALQQTELPVHVLWAENDPVAVIGMATVLSKEIKHATLSTLSEAGHFPMLEVPDRWEQRVVDFLQKSRGC